MCWIGVLCPQAIWSRVNPNTAAILSRSSGLGVQRPSAIASTRCSSTLAFVASCRVSRLCSRHRSSMLRTASGMIVSLSPWVVLLLGGLAERALAAVAGKAGALHHPDISEAAHRVDGHVGGIGAAVAKVVATNAPAEAIALRHRFRSLPHRHLGNRIEGNDLVAAIEDHLAKAAEIAGRGEEAAARHRKAMDAVGERIKQLVDRRGDEVLLIRAELVRLGQPLHLPGVRPERGIGHAER